MTLVRTVREGSREAYTKAHERLSKEITRSPADVVIPTEGSLAGSLARGDIFLHDPSDDGKETGAFAWISAEPDWTNPTELFAVHIWGPSERHLQILIDVCQWGVDNGIGDLPISYQRSTHPMTLIADQHASVTISRDGKYSRTTLRQALAGLTRAAQAVKP